MAIVNDIKDWIESGKPFFPGVELYKHIQGNIQLTFFNSYAGANWVPDDVQLRLQQELIQYYHDHKDDVPIQVQHPKQPIKQAVPNTETDYPPAILNLKSQAQQLHKEHSSIHAQLRTTNDKSTRYQIARTIMLEIIPQLDSIYDKIRIYEKTGVAPEFSEQEIVRKVLELVDRKMSIRTIISRLKRNIPKENNTSKRTKMENKLLDLQNELLDIDEKLGK